MRKIKGYIFKERYRDNDNAYDEYKAIRFYVLQYGKENLKVLSMVNQYGQGYRDIYVKENAPLLNRWTGDIVAIKIK